jgi:mannitol-specific phosphotransferase system IIBC component
MKKLIIIAGMITMISSTIWAQDATQNNTRNRDQNKTQMQQDDMNQKKTKKSSTKKMNKKKKDDEAGMKMDNYNSTKDKSGGNPKEQKQMDSSINNHR